VIYLEDGSRSRILSVLSVTTLASLLTGLNARLAIVGLPIIASELNADIDAVLWIIQGYMIGSTIIQLIVGRLADIYGRVRLFNSGFLIFITAAIVAGFSPNPTILILSRIIQGVGGAFLMTLSVTILTDNVPRDRLATWLGVNQVAWRVGAIMGLSLSGFIIDFLGWRWLYLSYAPIGLIFYLWSVKTLKDIYKPVEKPRIDKIGFILFTSFLSTLLISLTLFTFGSTYIPYAYTLLFISVALLGFFVFWEVKASSPALDFSLFRIWQFTGGIISQFLYSIGFGASITLLVLYLEVVRRFSATWTGIAIIPFELSYLTFGLLGGRISDKYGYVKTTVIGLFISSIAFYCFSTMNMETDSSLITLYQIMFGFGAGLFVAPNTSSIMTSVSQSKRGVASALRSISFNIGYLLSLNVAILSMVQFIPYDVASKLIMAKSLVSEGEYTVIDLLNALSKSFLIQAIAMASAIPFTLSRSLKK